MNNQMIFEDENKPYKAIQYLFCFSFEKKNGRIREICQI